MLEIVLTIDSCGHQVSIAEIDSIGSLQIPKKILDSNNIDKRVKIYNEDGVIKIEADNEK